MKPISAEYAEIINLVNSVNWHRKHCDHNNCNVSLFQIRKTIERLLILCRDSERQEAKILIEETNFM